MRTNIFDFKKQKKNKIVLEEEVTDGPFLIFLKKNKKLIILILALLALITAVIAIYYAVINIKDTSKVVTNLPSVVVDFGEQGSSINSSELIPTTGGKANLEFYSRYGNIGLKEGVILKIKELNTKKGKIMYFSDGSALLIRNNGTLIRISSLENNKYGINEDGILLKGAKTKEIKIEKVITLDDDTTITYYSDNSCYIYNKDKKTELLVRNSNRVVIENDRFKIITPSGVSQKLNNIDQNNYNITYYEDGTIKINYNNNTYIIRDIKDFDQKSLIFPNDNEATIRKEEILSDGSKIIYYTDGSAEYINPDNISIMIRQSKDIIYTKDRVIEIIETSYANEAKKRITEDETTVIYLDNAGALIENKDGTYSYIYENSNLKYENNNLKNDIELIKEINHKTTKDGTIIINLEDGNSIIIDKNGYKVVKTDSIAYDRNGNIASSTDDIKDDNKSTITKNHITIENRGEEEVKYHLAIELSDNYKKYANVALSPKYLRYNIIAGSTYLENQTFNNVLPVGTILEGNIKIKEETYILYTDKLLPGEKIEIDLGIWIDYQEITNDYQDSVFVGTLVVYGETLN